MNNSNLGANIKSLRKAFGETQDDLAKYLNVEKNTISNYENGKREPNKEILTKIAKHYMISVEELLSSDLKDIGNFDIDPYAFWKYLDIILPIKSSKEAMKNAQFKTTIKYHKALYDDLKDFDMDNLDKIDRIENFVVFFDYLEVCNNEEDIIPEAAVDFLAAWFLLVIIIKLVPQALQNGTAALYQMKSKDYRFEKIIEETDDESMSEVMDYSKELDDPEMLDIINDLFICLKHSLYSDLADYYLALKYFYNYVDNGLGFEYNRRIGLEMLSSFAMVENKYAARFLYFCDESMGHGSQNVD